MSTGETYDKQAVFASLAAELGARRQGRHIDQMAAAALAYERGARTLVGLAEEGQRVLYHDHRARVLQAIPVDRHGLNPDDADPIARDLGDAAPWVRQHGNRLAWIHPRYVDQRDGMPANAGQAVDSGV